MTIHTDAPKWIDLINESVHTSDDIDIGDILAINRDFVVVKRGFVNVHYYYIPISKVEGWDGHVLWLRITENEVKANYERDKIPDPSRYYVKDYPTYTAEYYPELNHDPSEVYSTSIWYYCSSIFASYRRNNKNRAINTRRLCM